MKINISKNQPNYGTVLALKAANFDVYKSINVVDGPNEFNINGQTYTNDATIARFVAKNSQNRENLLGKDLVEQTEIESFIALFEEYFENPNSLAQTIELTRKKLEKSIYLVSNRLTLADLLLWRIVSDNDNLQKDKVFNKSFIKLRSDPNLVPIHKDFGKSQSNSGPSRNGTVQNNEAVKNKMPKADVGKFIELQDAQKGKVVVRFPPEASGYLHIGHAKAALLNWHYRQLYEGQFIMRFDDTNPAKENEHFEEVIKKDVKMLGICPDRWTYTSDHFETMLNYCEKLLKEGHAYVDDSDAETMRRERDERVPSKNRDNSVDTNLELWEEMKRGSERGQQCCVRAKIDFKHNNGALRDPTIYRCKPEAHVRTGNKYPLYPTYDFACPIVDSIEGVTHALRTTEYHDRDEQYYWFCDALAIRKPHIWEYARLNMTHTVMSKRKLAHLVDQGLVDGWDDPRMPTVRGILRRGLTVEGLKNFILAQGGSRSIVSMSWDKLWAFNKKAIDPKAPRYTALTKDKPLAIVKIRGPVKEITKEVQLHPKDPQIGVKFVWEGPELSIEQVDAILMKPGDSVTFVNWGNFRIVDVKKEGETVTEIIADLDLENRDYKKTLKVSWLANVKAEKNLDVRAVYYDHIISKAIIGKDEDWKAFVNPNSMRFVSMTAEPPIKSLKKGDIIQLLRKGFFICDQPLTETTPLVLIEIPDGSEKVEEIQETAKPTSSTDAHELLVQIDAQGNLVRDFKANDPKSQETKDAIAKLLDLKKKFKEATGLDHKPGLTLPESKETKAQVPKTTKSETPKPAASGNDGESLLAQIDAQGILVRDLKSKDPKGQATKDAITKLLELKKQFKEVTGLDHKPGMTLPTASKSESTPSTTTSNADGDALFAQIEAQGSVVRELKSKDPKGQTTKDAIAKLLELKKQFKEVTGLDHKPGIILPASSKPEAVPTNTTSIGDGSVILGQIETQGNVVRDLKSKDPKGQATKDAIAKLLELKKKFKEVTGLDHKPGMKYP